MATLAGVQSVLLSRRRETMISAWWLDRATADDTALADYTLEPIAHAVRECGGTTADLASAADAEVGAVADVEQLLDLADLFLLESALAAYIQVDWNNDNRKQWLDQFRQGLAAQVADLRTRCERLYGYNLARPAAMTVDLGFAARGCDT